MAISNLMKGMNNPLGTAFSAMLVLGGINTCAYAGDLSLGITSGWSTKLYNGVGNNKSDLLFPTVDYETGTFWLHGLSAGADLYRTPQDRLSVLGYYLPLSFKPKDSSSWAMRQLNKRRSTLMTGLSYEHQTESWGAFKAILAADAIHSGNGLNLDTSWSYPVQTGALNIIPALGVNWSSKKFNQYYYGVSGSESRRSGLSAYNPDDSWSSFAELTLDYSLTTSLDIYGGARYTVLASEIKNSPMVAKGTLLGLWTGFSYSF
ncbi:MipA/OmpV family protein [Cronobacter dublinensis]